MKNVAIFKTGCLPATQTFIPAQVESLRRFKPTYVALERVVDGYPIKTPPVLLVKHRNLLTRLNKVAYKITGVAPGFYREVADIKASLLHAHFVLDGIHALPIATHLNLPLVVTLHGHIPTVYGQEMGPLQLDHILYRMRLQYLWRESRVFICVSDFIRRKALEIGYPPEKLRVHYIGIDRTKFKPADVARDPNLILFVGRLAEKKGASYLLKAMAEVRQTNPEARVVLVGDGPDRANLEQMSRDLKLDVRFEGARDAAEVLEWLRRARVFVAPSVTSAAGDAEALGMVFAEAQATGLPVVSFKHGGIPEVVRHGETGLLAPEKDTHTLARYIQQMLSDEESWQSYSRRSITWVEEQFDLVRQTAKLEEIYETVV
jgi:colanic acid/amylovoran biosynthesis glycosyltransferase